MSDTTTARPARPAATAGAPRPRPSRRAGPACCASASPASATRCGATSGRRDTVFFTFLFPLVMLGIFTAAFSSAGDIRPGPGAEGVSVGAYYLPGMLAAGMLLSGVQNLAIDIAREKGDGTLKRLGGTPLSPVSATSSARSARSS